MLLPRPRVTPHRPSRTNSISASACCKERQPTSLVSTWASPTVPPQNKHQPHGHLCWLDSRLLHGSSRLRGSSSSVRLHWRGCLLQGEYNIRGERQRVNQTLHTSPNQLCSRSGTCARTSRQPSHASRPLTWTIELRKQVFPRFVRPTRPPPGGRFIESKRSSGGGAACAAGAAGCGNSCLADLRDDVGTGAPPPLGAAASGSVRPGLPVTSAGSL